MQKQEPYAPWVKMFQEQEVAIFSYKYYNISKNPHFKLSKESKRSPGF